MSLLNTAQIPQPPPVIPVAYDTDTGVAAELKTSSAGLLVDQLVPRTSVTITKSDTTDLTATVTLGVKVGGGGSLVFRLVNDTEDTTLVVQPGDFVYGAFKRVMASTTATGIVGFGR